MGSLFGGGGGGGGGGGYQQPQSLPPVQNLPVAPGTLQQTILSTGPAKVPADTLVRGPAPVAVDETDEERRRRIALANSILGQNSTLGGSDNGSPGNSVGGADSSGPGDGVGSGTGETY